MRFAVQTLVVRAGARRKTAVSRAVHGARPLVHHRPDGRGPSPPRPVDRLVVVEHRAAIGRARAGRPRSPFQAPGNPSPRRARRPPSADPPIGADAVGWCVPNDFVNAVDNAMASIIALAGVQGHQAGESAADALTFRDGVTPAQRSSARNATGVVPVC